MAGEGLLRERADGGRGLMAGEGWWRERAGGGRGLVAGEGWRRIFFIGTKQ